MPIPSSVQARKMRMAISPRFAARTLWKGRMDMARKETRSGTGL
ncbi:MAG TPA: hypothetical protein VMT17_10380 [Anaeromyxobacteraceae bacterium]|nr:hypothetical protein [Anaeromyxobacteraceae bacterium]